MNSDVGKIRNWRLKVAKYTAYAMNGGLLNGQFTLKHILNLVPQLGNDINMLDTTLKVIDYLLYLTAESAEHQYKRLKEKAQRMNEEIVHSNTKYIFNHQIMFVLLEEGYIQKELLSVEQPTLFPKFLINLMDSDSTIDLKMSICRQISLVIKQSIANHSMTDSIKNAYKQIISPLVDLFRTPNKLLASMAADSLYQLSIDANDVKLVITQEGGSKIAVDYLMQKDERLLGHSLKLVQSLIYYEPIIDALLARKLMYYPFLRP